MLLFDGRLSEIVPVEPPAPSENEGDSPETRVAPQRGAGGEDALSDTVDDETDDQDE